MGTLYWVPGAIHEGPQRTARESGCPIDVALLEHEITP